MTITRVQVATDGRLSSGSATYQGMTTDEIAAHTASKFAEAEAIARQARAAFHANIHTRPQPACPDCPPTACPCGLPVCPDVADHLYAFGAAETTWREVAAR